MSQVNSAQPPNDFELRVEDFVPSLRQAFELEPLNLKKILRAAVPAHETDGGGYRLPKAMVDRRVIVLSDGSSSCRWETDSLRGLFRGDAIPPHLGAHPEAYNGSFVLLDLHAIEICHFLGDRTDDEMLEVYSTLRRRPDGRSQGILHDYMWQAAAIILGTRPSSQLEFEAIMSRLERSCRTFRWGPTSCNYVRSIREVFQMRGAGASE
jgi:hypothetical protein